MIEEIDYRSYNVSTKSMNQMYYLIYMNCGKLKTQNNNAEYAALLCYPVIRICFVWFFFYFSRCRVNCLSPIRCSFLVDNIIPHFLNLFSRFNILLSKYHHLYRIKHSNPHIKFYVYQNSNSLRKLAMSCLGILSDFGNPPALSI